MGADMLIATCAVKTGGPPLDFDAGHRLVNDADETTLRSWLAEMDIELWENDQEHADGEIPEMPASEARDILHGRIARVKQTLESRLCTDIIFGNWQIFIVGGLSWGDSPDGCQDLWDLEEAAPVMDAIGFGWPEMTLEGITHEDADE